MGLLSKNPSVFAGSGMENPEFSARYERPASPWWYRWFRLIELVVIAGLFLELINRL